MASPIDIYKDHGITNLVMASDGEYRGDCPWCASRAGSTKRGRGTFFIRADGELWSCKTCGVSGNVGAFLKEVVNHATQRATINDYRSLSTSRGGLQVRTFKGWGVGFENGRYVYPAWVPTSSVSAKTAFVMSDIRRFRIGKRPMSSPAGKAGLMFPLKNGLPHFRNSKTIWICEGEWDGMAWWEALQSQGIDDDVCAVPGAGTFPQKCLPLFQGKDVVTLYDNDEPGQAGASRVWGKLESIAGSLRRIKWKSGLPDGFDIRDLYMEHGCDGSETVSAVMELLTAEKYHQAGKSSQEPGATIILGGDGSMVLAEQDKINPDGRWTPPEEVLASYRKWLKLDHPEMLDVVFGSVFANRMDIDPLWLFFVGPPGCGKSELLMSLSSAPMIHCSTAVSNHTLISGMNFGKQDPSLLPKLLGRTWIVKDFTTVLGMPQQARDEVFSILRDAYDGKIEKPYGNMVVRRYEGRFGIIAGVTNKIDSATAGNAVLGERFIRWRTRHKGKILVGKDIIMQALDNLTEESQMRSDLRDIARKVLDRPVERHHYPTIPMWFKEQVIELAQWVAVMRGVVERERWTGSTGVIAAKPAPEIATRLAKQFCTLALGIGVYRGLKELDQSVYQIIAQVGCDTCPDRAEEVVRALFLLGGSASAKAVSNETRFPYDTVRWVMQDLDLLGVVRRSPHVEATFTLTKSVSDILSRMGIYAADKAWRGLDDEHLKKKTRRLKK